MVSITIFLSLISYAWSSSDLTPKRTLLSMASELFIESSEGESFFNKAAKDLHAFEKDISTWNSKSQLSGLNLSSKAWISLRPAIYTALKKSVACSQMTEGYFHPGLGKLIALWGIRDQLKIPAQKEITSTLKHADLSLIEFDDSQFRIRKKQKDLWFEEGGFAKGAAMDSIVQIAKADSANELFLNFSGQVYSKNKKMIGIANPEKRDSAAAFVEVEKESMATSGVGLQHFKHQGKIYGHILNPKTGFPVSSASKSVTVIHPENFWADCLATGLLAMSENMVELKKWLVANPEIKVILIEKKGGKLTAETSCKLKHKIKLNEEFSQINENC